MDLGIAGKRALVCAASKGLGRGCAQALADAGCDVTIIARTRGRAAAHGRGDRCARRPSGALGRVRHHDARGPRGGARGAAREPDILINNAGGPPPGDFRDWDRAAWIRALDANMLTPIELIKSTVDGMIARRFGRIVNITSSAVKTPIDILGLSNGARSGLTGFVAGIARKVAVHNVTINNLLPGSFDTDRLRDELRGARQGRRQAARRGDGGRSRGDPGGPLRQPRRVRRRLRVPLQRACGLHRRAEHPAWTAATTPARSDGRLRLRTLAHDRPLLLDHAERSQDHDLPRGDGPRRIG